MGCPFCHLPTDRIRRANDQALLVPDGFPLNPGHCLVLPRRHVASLFDATEEEVRALWQLLGEGRELIDQEHGPAGYNVGVNDGPAAGQTVAHLHIRLIPRYPGDTTDPRGGIRWVLPDRSTYWSEESR